MTDIDTSAEAVERLAAQCLEYGGAQSFAADVAATLRALVRERDEARALIEEMRAPYAIVAKREWQAGAKAMREAAAFEAEAITQDLLPNSNTFSGGYCNGGLDTARLIRALPIPERPA